MEVGAGIAPSFMTSAVDGIQWSASRPSLLPLEKHPLVLNGQEAGWVPECVSTLWSRENFLASTGNQTRPAQPVARIYTD
jgi:hypothetical protein